MKQQGGLVISLKFLAFLAARIAKPAKPGIIEFFQQYNPGRGDAINRRSRQRHRGGIDSTDIDRILQPSAKLYYRVRIQISLANTLALIVSTVVAQILFALATLAKSFCHQ